MEGSDGDSVTPPPDVRHKLAEREDAEQDVEDEEEEDDEDEEREQYRRVREAREREEAIADLRRRDQIEEDIRHQQREAEAAVLRNAMSHVISRDHRARPPAPALTPALRPELGGSTSPRTPSSGGSGQEEDDHSDEVITSPGGIRTARPLGLLASHGLGRSAFPERRATYSPPYGGMLSPPRRHLPSSPADIGGEDDYVTAADLRPLPPIHPVPGVHPSTTWPTGRDFPPMLPRRPFTALDALLPEPAMLDYRCLPPTAAGGVTVDGSVSPPRPSRSVSVTDSLAANDLRTGSSSPGHHWTFEEQFKQVTYYHYYMYLSTCALHIVQ